MPIVSDEDILGGEPRIEGTRIAVRQVAARILESGQSPAYVADQLDVSLATVYESLSYYYENAEQMREHERANEEAFDRLQESALSLKEPVE